MRAIPLHLRLGYIVDSNLAQNATTESGNGAGFHGDRARSIELFATGIAGLDDILGGGLARNHLYLIEGDPGTGKTTIAMQFLMEGTRRGQKGPLRHPFRIEDRTPGNRGIARLVARWNRNI